MQKMFVVIPPQKKAKEDDPKDAEMHEVQPLKPTEDCAATVAAVDA